MSDEPQFPQIPSLGDALIRKKKMEENKYSIIKCKSCKVKNERLFQDGDYVFKKLADEICSSCKEKTLYISEIFSEWKIPKKE